MPRRMRFFDPDIAERILAEVARGRSLTEVCRDAGMPTRRTVRSWVELNRNGFAVRFGRAREIGHGRPTRSWYSRELADRILEQIAAGRSVAGICRDYGLPARDVVFGWIDNDQDGFADRYRQAREAGHGKPRKVTYSAEVADRVIAFLSNGELLHDICQERDMPAANTIHTWVAEDREGFAKRYHDARTAGFHCRAEGLMVVADDHSHDWIVRRNADGTTEMILDPDRMARARLRFKATRWSLTKALPQHYGNRQAGESEAQRKLDQYERELAEMYALVCKGNPPLPGKDENEPEDET
jgi:transposase-like protein